MALSFLRVLGRLREDGLYEPETGWETERLGRRATGDPELTLELLDGSGGVVARGPVERRGLSCTGTAHSGPWRDRVSGHVILLRGADRLVLRQRDRIVHEAGIAAEPPALRLTSAGCRRKRHLTVAWEADHALPLTFNLAVIDGQGRRIPVAQALTGTSCDLDLDEVPAGGAVRVALLATDGVRSTAVRSDVVELPERRPCLRITAPGDGETLPPAQPFSLIGGAWDAVGRPLPAGGLVWSIDGREVARGLSVALAAPLPPGRHLVALAYGSHEGPGAGTVHHDVTVAAGGGGHENWLRVQRLLASEEEA